MLIFLMSRAFAELLALRLGTVIIDFLADAKLL
jgi:hypothetical protein